MSASTATARDFARDHPPITEGVEKPHTFGLRGLARRRRVEDDEMFDHFGSFLMGEDPYGSKDNIRGYEVEGEEEDEEDTITISFNGADGDEGGLIVDFIRRRKQDKVDNTAITAEKEETERAKKNVQEKSYFKRGRKKESTSSGDRGKVSEKPEPEKSMSKRGKPERMKPEKNSGREEQATKKGGRFRKAPMGSKGTTGHGVKEMDNPEPKKRKPEMRGREKREQKKAEFDTEIKKESGKNDKSKEKGRFRKDPTGPPSSIPTSKPTEPPSSSPTSKLADAPSSSPTSKSADAPSSSSMRSPSNQPSSEPSVNQPTEGPTNHPTAQPVTGSPSQEPTGKPITNNPTRQPTLKPITDSPTKLPISPSSAVDTSEDDQYMAKKKPCPPHYSTSATYTAGDTIESDMHIYQCQSPPYEEYCNIAELDEGWSDAEQDLWYFAWVHLRVCEGAEEEWETGEGRDDAATVQESAEAPITAQTTSTAVTTVQFPPCPSAYNPFKSNYIAGDQVTVKCFIFQCRDEEHALYCNIAAWNDSLLAGNGNAKELWGNAWEEMGACAPTQEELMEEEAVDASWDCLV